MVATATMSTAQQEDNSPYLEDPEEKTRRITEDKLRIKFAYAGLNYNIPLGFVNATDDVLVRALALYKPSEEECDRGIDNICRAIANYPPRNPDQPPRGFKGMFCLIFDAWNAAMKGSEWRSLQTNITG